MRLVFLSHRGDVPPPGPFDSTAFALNKLIDDIERARQEVGIERIVVIVIPVTRTWRLSMRRSIRECIPCGHDLYRNRPERGNSPGGAQYWQDSFDPERKAILKANRVRLPDEELANLPAAERFIKGYIRDGPMIWYDPNFDSGPLGKGSI